jgi:exodeoxyribonuclease-3
VCGLRDGAEEPEQSRLIAGTLEGIKVVCVYVPNGQSPDSPKFAYKLAWFERLRAFLTSWAKPSEAVLVVGDFNVAPDDRDVHDPDAWRGKVLFHPDEHAALGGLLDWGLVDLLRVHEAAAGIYSWWDYRRLAFPRHAGLRIDLALGTKDLASRTTGVWIDRDMRKGKKPSDHAPVFTFLDEPPRLEA